MPNSRGTPLPPAVVEALERLGADIRHARLRQRIRAVTVAQRACISRTTFHRIERGSPAVSIGSYAAVLHVLDLHHGIGELADRSRDALGPDGPDERLPQRVRVPRGL